MKCLLGPVLPLIVAFVLLLATRAANRAEPRKDLFIPAGQSNMRWATSSQTAIGRTPATSTAQARRALADRFGR